MPQETLSGILPDSSRVPGPEDPCGGQGRSQEYLSIWSLLLVGSSVQCMPFTKEATGAVARHSLNPQGWYAAATRLFVPAPCAAHHWRIWTLQHFCQTAAADKKLCKRVFAKLSFLLLRSQERDGLPNAKAKSRSGSSYPTRSLSHRSFWIATLDCKSHCRKHWLMAAFYQQYTSQPPSVIIVSYDQDGQNYFSLPFFALTSNLWKLKRQRLIGAGLTFWFWSYSCNLCVCHLWVLYEGCGKMSLN